MSHKSQYLFVYGTLRRDSPHIMSRLLHQHSRPLGPASLPGRLFDLGEYPGATNHAQPDDLIHGELYELLHPDHTLPMLDDYEGCGPNSPFPHLFVRQSAKVSLANGRLYNAWVYWYNDRVDERQRIPHGDYIRFLNPEQLEEAP